MSRHAAQVRPGGRRIALMERSGCCWSQMLALSRYTIMCSLINPWLTWKARGSEHSTSDARDGTGRHAGYVTNISGPWTIYLTP
jgi:hypothetical protein